MDNGKWIMENGKWSPICLFWALIAWFVWSIQRTPFFWDSIQLGSKHAHFFYENGLKWDLLPVPIDSGHPPLLGYYLACCWKFFGKSLAVGHWAMFPFLCGIVYFLWRIGEKIGGKEWAYWLLPLVLLDPVVGGQALLVGPDIILFCFFLMALNGLIQVVDQSVNRMWLLLGVLGLCLSSMRGMMCAAALFGFFLLQQRNKKNTIFTIDVLYFLPGFMLGLSFLLWHWMASGWMGFHPDSPWAAAFEPVGVKGFVRNVAVLGWRYVDLGRCWEWLLLFFLGWRGRKIFPREMGLLFGCMLLFLSWSALRYQNLNAHRYFLPCFLVLHLLVFQWITRVNWTDMRKKAIFFVLTLGMASGHFWVYPQGISMDWDCTWASMPYHGLRKEAISFLETRGVDVRDVGTAFPNVNCDEVVSLNGDLRGFAEKDLGRNGYVMVSNVFNDFSREELVGLDAEWVCVFEGREGFVWVKIFKRAMGRDAE